jgi:hypothetical protein
MMAQMEMQNSFAIIIALKKLLISKDDWHGRKYRMEVLAF